MTTPDTTTFDTFLTRFNALGTLRDESLRQDLSSTLNRNRMTGEGIALLVCSTRQLAWMISVNPTWPPEHPVRVALLLQALIEEHYDVLQQAKTCALIPPHWQWLAWADGFNGSQAELLSHLQGIPGILERCAAVSLATRGNSGAIGNDLLAGFRLNATAATYHTLLCRALAGSQAANIAHIQLTALRDTLEVLFVTDTDATIARLVLASDLDHPEEIIAPVAGATGDFTRTAIARRHCERGRYAEALATIKDLRFLSAAFDQAIVIAALSALEIGELPLASVYAGQIPEPVVRLKIQTRIAQAQKDPPAEVAALVDLYQLCPRDVEVFIQLVDVLDRIKQPALANQVCLQAQERFVDHPTVTAIVQRHLAAAR